MTTNCIEEYYDGCPELEWNRLERHRVEFALTLRALREYLPAAPARVADIGGSVGRYSIALAEQGYAMTLIDLSARCLEFAGARAAEAGVTLTGRLQADARDLSALPDASFDAVLLMGPLYHLFDHRERLQAVHEAWRVLRPGGRIAAAFINRYAILQFAAVDKPEYINADREEFTSIMTTGVYRRRAGSLAFIDAWFAHPGEVIPLMAAGGFTPLDLFASDPLVNETDQGINATTGTLWEQWVDALYGIARDPCILGACGHLLFVGEVRARPAMPFK